VKLLTGCTHWVANATKMLGMHGPRRGRKNRLWRLLGSKGRAERRGEDPPPGGAQKTRKSGAWVGGSSDSISTHRMATRQAMISRALELSTCLSVSPQTSSRESGPYRSEYFRGLHPAFKISAPSWQRGKTNKTGQGTRERGKACANNGHGV